MKRCLFLTIIIFILSLDVALGAETITVYGTLIDTKCYGTNHSNNMNDHDTIKGELKNCASICC